MKRSEINSLIRSATQCFGAHHWALPPNARWEHEERDVSSGAILELEAGSRVTLVPGVYHEFYPVSDECIIGEVSTANDDLHDNFFVNPDVGRYPGIQENESPILRLISEKPA